MQTFAYTSEPPPTPHHWATNMFRNQRTSNQPSYLIGLDWHQNKVLKSKSRRGYSSFVQCRPRSRTSTRKPFAASRQAVTAPPKPLPITITSYLSSIGSHQLYIAEEAIEKASRDSTDEDYLEEECQPLRNAARWQIK